MTDITKCSNKDCPIGHICWRKLVPDDNRQSYSEWKWKNVFGSGILCSGFWDEDSNAKALEWYKRTQLLKEEVKKNE